MPTNLVNLEAVSKAYGVRILLNRVSIGVAAGDRVGVVGRNGEGKTTLVRVLAGVVAPDAGRVTHARGLGVGLVAQRDELAGAASVRKHLFAGRPEHEWAADPTVRDVLNGLLGGAELLDRPIETLSGGERRRVSLAIDLVRDHDLLILDEPTNHLDIEAISWLAGHLPARRLALVVVTHDRWLLDAVASRIWEVVDGDIREYDGGYSSYVLAKAERARLTESAESKRQNLIRKELAWLRRGPPARTRKPKFRLEAAGALIANEPPARNALDLARFATAWLGKTVYELNDVTIQAGEPGRLESASTAGPSHPAADVAAWRLLDRVTWTVGPGERIGLVGANGSGKTMVLRTLAGQHRVAGGRMVVGATVRAAYLPQTVDELDPSLRAVTAVEEVRRYVRVGKREHSAAALLERLGLTGERQWTRVGELSGGERRRLQILRLLMTEPNVLLLDEPTNDLDIEMLTAFEDLLDGWPGTLIVVSHDRYFLERVTDHVVGLLSDGTLAFLPGGVDEYLARRAASAASSPRPAAVPADSVAPTAAASLRDTRRTLARIERRLDRLAAREAELHAALAAHSTDYVQVTALDEELRDLQVERADLEEQWLMAAEAADGQEGRTGPRDRG